MVDNEVIRIYDPLVLLRFYESKVKFSKKSKKLDSEKCEEKERERSSKKSKKPDSEKCEEKERERRKDKEEGFQINV